MKILFDCRYVRIERHDGVSRFSSSLVEALGRRVPVTMVICDERQLAQLPALPWVMGPSPTSIRELATSVVLNRQKPDVVFTPMQTMSPLGRRFALVTTVHDLIYYRNRTPPRDLAWPVRLLWRLYHLSWLPQRLLLRGSDAHVAVSATTRDLMLRHRLTRRPIAVVTNAVDREPQARHDRPDSGQLAYMGSFMPYKNVELLARALHELPGWRLVLLSRASDADRARLEALAPEGALEFRQGASDEEYRAVLRESTALVTASLDEGFGIPLVEAMAEGTPVIASDIPIFREIGSDAAVYFDPRSTASLAAAVTGLVGPGEWERRSALGLARAADFSWDASAARLLELLQSTVATRGGSAR